MKLPLATGVLSAAILAGCTPVLAANGRFVLRVDRTFDRKAQPSLPVEELSGEAYREGAPADRWDVVIEGARIVLTEMDNLSGFGRRLEGWEDAPAPEIARRGERRFHLGTGGLGESGRFVLRGDEAELTLYGAGVPVLMSERGKLLPR